MTDSEPHNRWSLGPTALNPQPGKAAQPEMKNCPQHPSTEQTPGSEAFQVGSLRMVWLSHLIQWSWGYVYLKSFSTEMGRETSCGAQPHASSSFRDTTVPDAGGPRDSPGVEPQTKPWGAHTGCPDWEQNAGLQTLDKSQGLSLKAPREQQRGWEAPFLKLNWPFPPLFS